MKPLRNRNNTPSLFIELFRLVFVAFSLFLLGDAFSRWDGFSHYAPFSEFLPSVALAFVLWSLVSVLVTVGVWSALKLFERVVNLSRLEIRIEHILFLACVFVLSGALVWKGKKLVWPDVETTRFIKLAALLCVTAASLLFTFITRQKTERWLRSIQERITPLVWIFGVLIFLSVPLVAYCTWIKDNNGSPHEKSGLTQKTGGTRPNIIMVTFDTFAALEMSAYGYHKNTTPFINKWAEKSTVFAKAEAGSNFTASTTASLMTGKRVWTHQTYHIEGSKPIRSTVESLPAVLKEYGYYNLAFVVNPFASVKVLGLSESFDVAPPAVDFSVSRSLFGWKFGLIDVMLYRAFGERIRIHNWIFKNDFILSKILNLVSRNITETTVPPEKAYDRFLEIIDDKIPGPFFAWIHLFPPHDPYLPPEQFKGLFNLSGELRDYKSQEKLIEESYKYLFQYQPVPEELHPSVELMRAYYDEFMVYIDESYRDFIDELNERKVENTIIILSSDHGESFEHGYLTHGGPFLYEQVTHVPLIINEPGQDKGSIVEPVVEQIDIPATILDLVDIPVPAWMEGRSLVPLMQNKALPPRPAFSMNFEENRSLGHKIEKGSVAVWDGDYKLIHYLSTGESLLFNLKQDPNELNNLLEKESVQAERLLKLIQFNLDKANERIGKTGVVK